jgi:hypothetical protein
MEKESMINIRLLIAFFIVSGIALYGCSDFYFSKYLPPEGIAFLKELGIALIITAMIAFVLDLHLNKKLIADVKSSIEPLEHISDILQGAEISGVKNIIVRRIPKEQLDFEEKWRDRWKKIVKAHILRQTQKDKGRIRILCAAGYDFFRKTKIIGETLHKEFSRQGNNCTLEVLLLDDSSKWARHRQQLEPSFPTIAENKISKDFLDELVSHNKNVQYKLYDWLPIVLLVITDEVLFVETYPLIKKDDNQGPIGGWSPMLMIKPGTEAYDIWNSHFSYIWNNPVEPKS